MSIRRGHATVITFDAIDEANVPDRLPDLTFLAGETMLSIDGGTAFQPATQPVQIVGMPGSYQFPVLHAEANGDSIHFRVTKTGMVPVGDIVMTDSRRTFLVASDGANTASTFKTNLPSAIDDFYADAYLQVASGALEDQVKKIIGYDGATKFVTLKGPLAGIPAPNVIMRLVSF